jgi:phosphoglycolate phosphatase-like HAD superfamily hydrolase
MPSEVAKFKKVRIFWDIDGTLIRTNGAAAVPFKEAINYFLGNPVELNRKKLSGFTDYEIIESIFNELNVPFNEKDMDNILNKYVEKLPESLKRGKVEIIDSIPSTLQSIKNSNILENSIGTGNCHYGAQIKLKHVGIKKFFDDSNIFNASILNKSRNDILKLAKNSLLPGQFAIVIGDSPKDITSAHKNGLPIISVTTGLHSAQDLLEFGPDVILDGKYDFKQLNQTIISFFGI